ncbi:MAG: hypothetical protein M1840_001741 [Geoglossum simile]|nr:MAG: hypothetical protein M1840_001741 [Geoglossum simile]
MTAERFGGGLVEISAVATIVGAPTAEALIHGLKAACGMVWGPMSSFGAIHVTKACLSASVPDWLRESLGLRNAFVDAAIGVMLRVNRFKQAKNRVDLGDACAIQVTSSRISRGVKQPVVDDGATRRRRPRMSTQLELGSFRQQPPRSPKSEAMCIYTLDRNSQLALDTVPAALRGEAVLIHRFVPDIDGIHPAWKDWAVLLLSLGKVIESFALWKLGSHRIWYWTAVGWSHAFLSAIILQLSGLGRDHPLRSSSDIIAGALPTPLQLGGFGKVVLGMPANVRRHPLWRSLLALGTLFNGAGLFGMFIFLGREPATVIYVWVGFQVLWLASRAAVFYFVEGAAAARQGVVLAKSWEEASIDDRDRVMTLLNELSNHQVSIHPRGVQAYLYDCLSLREVLSHFGQANWELTMSLSEKSGSNSIDIRAATGDPLIRSAVWFTEANLNNSELYDAAIAFTHVNNDILAVPCVRVYACDCLREGDRQRGNAHADCGKLEWMYFIPTHASGGGQWIYAHGSAGVGVLRSEPLSAHELNRRFEMGRWKISFQSLADLELALDVSRSAGALVMDLVKYAADLPPSKTAAVTESQEPL